MKFITFLIAAICVGLVGGALAGNVPNYFSTTPYAYDGLFPANQLNQNFAYSLIYTDAITPQNWQVVTASQVTAAGNRLAVNTTSAAITITLPSPPATTSPLTQVMMLDAARTFNTNNLTVNASGIAPLNSQTGASATFTGSTQGSEVTCTYLNSTIGYNCGVR